MLSKFYNKRTKVQQNFRHLFSFIQKELTRLEPEVHDNRGRSVDSAYEYMWFWSGRNDHVISGNVAERSRILSSNNQTSLLTVHHWLFPCSCFACEHFTVQIGSSVSHPGVMKWSDPKTRRHGCLPISGWNCNELTPGIKSLGGYLAISGST